jgi:phytase-like protein
MNGGDSMRTRVVGAGLIARTLSPPRFITTLRRRAGRLRIVSDGGSSVRTRARIAALLASFLCATALYATASHAGAGPVLIAVGNANANTDDMAAETASSLENGVPGNRLEGVGSGLAYAGGNTFVALPDRGPNASTYNACVDDTTSYINRFHTFRLVLAPSPSGATLPFTLNPALLGTTLLSSPSPLVYGHGGSYGVGCGVLPTGAPALNAINHTHYLTGRSDGFDPTQISASAANGRFDPESIRVANNGASVFISDEYGPYVYQFDRRTGRRIAVFTLPNIFAIRNLSSMAQNEIDGNTSGRVSNRGMEGLAITPDGRTLVGILQSALLQEGGSHGSTTRIVTIDIETGAVLHEYGYRFDNIGTVAKPKYGAASDILALNDHEFLVDERDGSGLGDDSAASFKRLYKIDLDDAVDVSAVTDPAVLASCALSKSLFLDIVAALTAAPVRMSAADIPAKLEGIAFGEDVVIDGVVKHTLCVSNDNDFVPAITDTHHPAGIDNPNTFFVFAFDDHDLHGSIFVPQQLVGNNQRLP